MPLDKFVATLREDMRTLERRTMRAIHRTADVGVGVVRAKAPDAFGEIKAGLVANGTAEGAEIRSTAPHSGAVENGRRPGAKMPPIEAIERWVRLRGMQGLDGGDPRMAGMIADVGGRPPRGDVGERSRADTPRRVAFLIARKIAERGIPPTFFMGSSVPALEALFGEILEEEFAKPLG